MTSSYQERVSGGIITKGVDRWILHGKEESGIRKEGPPLHHFISQSPKEEESYCTSPSAGRHVSRTRSKSLLTSFGFQMVMGRFKNLQQIT